VEENKLRLKKTCLGQENINLEQILVLGPMGIVHTAIKTKSNQCYWGAWRRMVDTLHWAPHAR